MKRLILHVGPGKCGSSTIQHFLTRQEKLFEEPVAFHFLTEETIIGLQQDPAVRLHVDQIHNFLECDLADDSVKIISHEYLFQNMHSMMEITRIARSLNFVVSIIGFCRRQSEWLVSAYKQWTFRRPQAFTQDFEISEATPLDAAYFTGLEQYMINSIVTDFSSNYLSQMNWRMAYGRLREQASKQGAKVKCRVLPKKGMSGSLIDDFVEMAGLHPRKYLTADEKSLAFHGNVINPSFHDDLVELISIAASNGYAIPYHEYNQALTQLSSVFAQLKRGQGPDNRSKFTDKLKSYIDSYFHANNVQFAREFDLQEDYFAVDYPIGKRDILDQIRREIQQRRQDPHSALMKHRQLASLAITVCLQREDSFKGQKPGNGQVVLQRFSRAWLGRQVRERLGL
jgi:hypothetical protein